MVSARNSSASCRSLLASSRRRSSGVRTRSSRGVLDGCDTNISAHLRPAPKGLLCHEAYTRSEFPCNLATDGARPWLFGCEMWGDLVDIVSGANRVSRGGAELE